jgi:hypothetical protein
MYSGQLRIEKRASLPLKHRYGNIDISEFWTVHNIQSVEPVHFENHVTWQLFQKLPCPQTISMFGESLELRDSI